MDEPRSIAELDLSLRPGSRMSYLYGGRGDVAVESHPDPGNNSRYVRLDLEPMQFVILR